MSCLIICKLVNDSLWYVQALQFLSSQPLCNLHKNLSSIWLSKNAVRSGSNCLLSNHHLTLNSLWLRANLHSNELLHRWSIERWSSTSALESTDPHLCEWDIPPATSRVDLLQFRSRYWRNASRWDTDSCLLLQVGSVKCFTTCLWRMEHTSRCAQLYISTLPPKCL